MSATYGNLNIATAWEAISDQIGDLTAIYSGENSESWEEFEKRSASLAKTFSEKGLKPVSYTHLPLPTIYSV